VRWKVTAVFLAFSAVCLAGFGLFAFQSGHGALMEAVASDLSSAVNEKEKALKTWIEQHRDVLVALADSERLVDSVGILTGLPPVSPEVRTTRRDLLHGLGPWVGPGKAFESLLLLHPESGVVVFASDEAELGTLKENRGYFLDGQNAPTITRPFFSVTKGTAVIAVSTPVKDRSGRLLGVLVGRLDMKGVDAIMWRRVGLDDTFDSYLVNTARLMVTQPRDVRDPAVLSRGIYMPYVTECLKGGSGWVTGRDFRGIPAIVAYRWSPDFRLCVIAKLDQSEAFAASRLLGWRTFWGGIGILILAGLLAVLLSKWITRPVIRLHDATRAVEAGDRRVRVEFGGNDEIARLARGFNDMVSGLDDKDRQIAAYTATLEQRVDERTTELRRAQQDLVKQERLATLGRLAATVSHELRNPLGAIGTSLAVLDAKTRNQHLGVEKALDRMQRGIARCDGIIGEMLDYARDRQLTPAPVDLDAWVAEFLDEMEIPGGIRVDRRLNTPGALVSLDAELMRRALVNIYSNACHAMQDSNRNGGADRVSTLTVETVCADGWAEISFADTGTGIAEDVLANVFEPLFSTKSFGVGLGLLIVKKIVELHRGTIAIDSTPGCGTRVTVRIPQNSGNGAATASSI